MAIKSLLFSILKYQMGQKLLWNESVDAAFMF